LTATRAATTCADLPAKADADRAARDASRRLAEPRGSERYGKLKGAIG
jgi:hypothetical protein